MSGKILCVDDDPNILMAYQRQLRKQYQIDTAAGGEEALKKIASDGPYAVVVSDLRMPGMDGIQFLAKVRQCSPDSVRIMLTGNADLEATIESVNEGNIFRFLTKPCSTESLIKALDAGIQQYRLVIAERDLLQKTLSGSVKVLIDVLSLASPIAFGRAARIRNLMKKLALYLDTEHAWEFEIAGMLSQIGCVALPNEIMEKIASGKSVSPLEKRIYESHPQVGYDLLKAIPRLENVAEAVVYQEKHYNGEGVPSDNLKGEQLPLTSRALHVVLAYDSHVSAGKDQEMAIAVLRGKTGWYDPAIVESLALVIQGEHRYRLLSITLDKLNSTMITAEDIVTVKGLLVISKGQEVSGPLLTRLKNFASTMKIREPFKVLVPIENPR